MAKINHTDFTYQVSYKWLSMNTDDRTDKLGLSKEYPDYSMIEVQDAFDNGHVVLRIEETIPANIPGLFLLELEDVLEELDEGITIWLEPVGDKCYASFVVLRLKPDC